MSLSRPQFSVEPVQNLPPAADRRRRHLQAVLFARVLLFSLLLGGLALLPNKEGLLPSWPLLVGFTAGVLGLSIFSALWLQHAAVHQGMFSRWQLLLDLACGILLITHSGGSRSIFLPMLLFPVSTGALVLQRHGSLKAAAAATLLLAGVFTLEYFGIRINLPGLAPPLPPPASWTLLLNIFAVHGSTFFLIALFAELLAQRLARTERALLVSERDLAQLSRLYKQIFDDIRVGIITVDDHGRITSFNGAAEQITGRRAAEVWHRHLVQCFPSLDLSEATGVRRTVDLLQANGQTIRVACIHADLRMPAADDEETASSGCRVLTLEDVTQLERMEEQVRQTEKMAAIGNLSAAIAHDMRNPLAAISGAAQLLNLDGASHPDPVFPRLLEIILRESTRLAAVISDFLQFARPATAASSWFDGHRLVEECWAESRNDGESPPCRLNNAIEPGLHFWGDRQQVQTILRHLFDNSCHACREREGVVRVTAQELTQDDGSPWLTLEVCDNGPGLPAGQEERIFEPFFSTREDGTGLGLAIVRQLAEKHQGSVRAQSSPSGCSIILQLPLPPEEPLTDSGDSSD